MGRNPCCSKVGLNRGAWTAMEDQILTSYIQLHGEGKWRNLPQKAGIYSLSLSLFVFFSTETMNLNTVFNWVALNFL